MSPRHFPWQIIEETAYAAYIGGAAGTSSQSGYDYAKKWLPDSTKFDLYGSIPHALNAVCGGSSVGAARFYHREFPYRKLTALIDFEGQELDACTEAFTEFGDKLYAIRIDTHGGRYCQGCTEYGYAQIPLNQNKPHRVGMGVTIEAATTLREHLDGIGAKKVKIIVSSGFNAEKVEAFVDADAPIDAIGTGSSWVKFFMFTSDIAFIYNGQNNRWIPCCKAGREHGQMVKNRIIFERGHQIRTK